MKFIWVLSGFLLLTQLADAQEINFSRVQDMAVWYNQSLKTDKHISLKFNMRNVQYGGLTAYKSISAMAEIPLVSAEGRESENAGYLSVSVGGASDKSNQGILNNTLGLAGISYAIPFAGNETYIAVGLQGSYYQSRLNIGEGAFFGDQYDQYGPVDGAMSVDRLASGWSYNHININGGISVFSNAEQNKWYLGASVMHINRPFTDDAKTGEFRLRQALSVQGGYKYITPENNDCSFYMTLNWQGKAYKHFFNVSYFKAIEGIKGGVGLGLGYRYDDAIVPAVEARYANATIALGYDVNVSDINAAGFKRNGVELAVKLEF